MTDLQKAQVAALIRALLYIFGPLLTKHGIDAKDPGLTENIEVVVGILIPAGAFVWSLMHKATVAPAVAVAKEVQAGTAFINRPPTNPTPPTPNP